MKSFKSFIAERCWPGYKSVPGKKAFSSGSCMKEDEVEEDWQDVNHKDKTDGLSQKAVNAYRSENPGSKLKTLAGLTSKPTAFEASLIASSKVINLELKT